MARAYANLKKRIDDLALALLPSRANVGDFTTKEEDLIRSYVLLAHAELESFLEELALDIVKQCQRLSTPSRCYLVISRLVFYRAAIGNKGFEMLDDASIAHAYDFFKAIVESNHGVKRQNILQLFLPLGLNHNDFDETFLANLDALGIRRGDFAHRSSKMYQGPDPSTERSRINQILPEVSRLDQVTRSLIRLK